MDMWSWKLVRVRNKNISRTWGKMRWLGIIRKEYERRMETWNWNCILFHTQL